MSRVQAFDHVYVHDLLKRLRSIPHDAQPRWGCMTPPALIDHLVRVLRYSMGKGPESIDHSNWLTRKILAPVMMSGLLPIPRNIKISDALVGVNNIHAAAGLETLHALLEEYFSLVQAGALSPAPHPVLGDVGIDGWARLHVLHFEHHFRQFGV